MVSVKIQPFGTKTMIQGGLYGVLELMLKCVLVPLLDIKDNLGPHPGSFIPVEKEQESNPSPWKWEENLEGNWKADCNWKL